MKTPDWSKFSDIAEVLSSVAILATLLYLVIQTQQNAAAIEASSRQTMILVDLEVLQMAPKELLAAKDELTTLEMEELQKFLVALVRSREFVWFQFRDGQIDLDIWESYLGALGSNLSWPRTRAWWEAFSVGALDPTFVSDVNKFLATIPIREDLRHNFEVMGID